MSPSTICSVCESKPAWMNFGSITCASCKMFFRRNENYDLIKNKCRFNTICNINPYTRRTCTYCRLKKCFSIGMKRELFRSAHGVNTPYNETKKEIIYPLDLLENDRSTLTINQWTLLSNIINTYDMKCPIKDIQNSINIQLTYPAKIRMKSVSANYMNFLSKFYGTLVDIIEGVFHLNISSKNDRKILIERTITSLGGLNGLFIVRELNLHNNYEYTSCAITIYGSTLAEKVAYNADHMDSDGTLIKILLIILSFSTCYDTIKQTDSNLLLNTNEVFLTQNIYIEIMFKYMLFRYGYNEASIRFSKLIKIVLDQNMCLETTGDVQSHKIMVKTVIQDADRIISSD